MVDRKTKRQVNDQFRFVDRWDGWTYGWLDTFTIVEMKKRRIDGWIDG